MATTYKILAQQTSTVGSAGTPTLIYGPIGAGLATVVSTIAVCNRGTTASTYRISIRENGAAEATKQYLVYDASISGNSTVTYTLGLTLAAGDAIYVYSSSVNLSYQIFGSEVSI